MPNFYAQVPKTLAENLAYRVDLRKRAAADKRFQQACIAACREDVLYWLNAFVWLYEPRPVSVNGAKMPFMIPFITWPHQDPAILKIREHLGYRDIGVEKSRSEGMSWIAVLMALHDWLFHPMTAIGLVSKDQDAADNPENPDSLLWKVDWELTKLPKWMRPQFKRLINQHSLRNIDNGSTITAYAATGDVASGGRKTWFLMDELAKFPRGPDVEAMASTQYVTNSRLVVSTPKGTEGAYYQLMHEPSNMERITLDWKDNPTRNRGLYRLVDNVPVAVDAENNPLSPEYSPPSEDVLEMFSRLRTKGFTLENRIRSPWYDFQCDRPQATPQSVAQELDRDYGGSMYRIFVNEFFEKAEKTVSPPRYRGTVTWHPDTLDLEFGTLANGQTLLWCNLKGDRPPPGNYVFGADVASGLGGSWTSNSALIGIDLDSGEQVFEFASNTIQSSDFADMAVSVCNWFHNAYLIWEYAGPGVPFQKRIKDRGYQNVYYRDVLWKKSKRKTKAIGWVPTPDAREMLFEELSRTVRSGNLVLRSDILVKECGQYVRVAGKIVHVGSATTQDDSSMGRAHGDRVIAAGLCMVAARDRPTVQRAEESKEVPRNSMAERDRIFEGLANRSSEDWDDRTNWDLARPHSPFQYMTR